MTINVLPLRAAGLRIEYHALEAATRDPEVLMAQQVAALAAAHHFPLDETMAAYDTFAEAATTAALKVVLTGAKQTGAATVKGTARAVA